MITKEYCQSVRSRCVNECQRVLYELWHAIVIKRKFCLSQTYGEWISGGGLPLQALRGVQNGGDAADVRIRDLENKHSVPFVGCEIRGRRHRYTIHEWKNIKGKKTYYYKLDIKPEDIDWEELFAVWPKWHYTKPGLF